MNNPETQNDRKYPPASEAFENLAACFSPASLERMGREWDAAQFRTHCPCGDRARESSE